MVDDRRVLRSQFNAVRMFVERCVIKKAAVQSFYLRDNISSNKSQSIYEED